MNQFNMYEPEIILMLSSFRGKEFNNKIEYFYSLMYQGGVDYRHPSVLTTNLYVSKNIRHNILETLRNPNRTIEDIKDIGKKLYQEFIPERIREEIERLDIDLKLSPVILLVTDDHEIPWELIFDDKFWSLKYPFGRIYGEPYRRFERPLSALDIIKLDSDKRRKAVLISPCKDLPGAYEEIKNLEELFKQINEIGEIKSLVNEEAKESNVIGIFASNDYDIIHYAGHGKSVLYNQDNKYIESISAAIELFDNSLDDIRIKQLKLKNKPLIFLNACETADGIFVGDKTENLATSFIHAGASAVIGTLWKVSDNIASKFATEFYKSIVKEKPFGISLMEAKKIINALREDNKNLDWASFILYGFPTRKMLTSSNITQIVIEMSDRKGTLAKVVKVLSDLKINLIGSKSLTYKSGERAGYIAEIQLPKSITFKKLSEKLKGSLPNDIFFKVREQ